MPDPLNSYSVKRAITHLELPDNLREPIQQLVGLLDDNGRVQISEIQKKLFPFVQTDSANNATQKLRKTINKAAKKQEINLTALITRAKKGGAENRWFWFEGAPVPPLLARTSELDSIPEERLVRDQHVRNAGLPTIVLLTFNMHETQAVKKVFNRNDEQINRQGTVYTDLGIYGESHVLHRVSRQGVSEAQLVTEECIREFSPDAIIGVGIAFGVDKQKQEIGDVLVSTGVNDYELQKVKQGVIEPRGLTAPASPLLIERFTHLTHCWEPDGTDGNPRIIDGVLLSGNKLIDDVDYRDSLAKLSGTQIIGGEMEGLGIQKPAYKKKLDWIVVKAICDFGDGNKGAASKESDQKKAALNAAWVVRAALDVGPLYSDRWTPPGPPALPSFKDDHIWIDSRGVHATLDKEAPPSEGAGVDVMDQLTMWALDPEAPTGFALLGEYGMGKTVTTQRFARHLRERRAADPTIPLSFYFDLREVTGLDEAVPTIDQIVTEVMKRTWPTDGMKEYTFDSFLTWLQEPTVVIFDGLDEVLVKLTKGNGQTFTRTLLSLLSPADGRPIPKVLISCRTQYFRTLRDERNHFTGQERDNVRADAFRAMVLLPFDETQVITYLEAAFPGENTQRLLDTVRSVHDLEELTKRPYTLSLVTRYLPEIERDRAAGKPVYGVTLYRRTAQLWLERDEGKHQIDPEDKQSLAAHLAAYLWASRQPALPATQIERWFRRWLHSDEDLSLLYKDVKPDLLAEDLRTATFLTRVDSESGSAFRFSHTSLQEYFLAEYLLDAIRLDLPERWCLPRPSDETFDFLGQLLAEASDPALLSTLSRWAPTYRREGSENLLCFTLRAREKKLPSPSLRGIDLHGAHLDDLVIKDGGTAFDLTGANLSSASLRRVAFHNVLFTGANLHGAVLHQSYFLECSLNGADLTQADLTGAAIRHSHVPDLADARTDGLQHEPRRTQDHAPQRAALAESPPAQPAWAHSSPPTVIAFSPDGTTLATGSWDGTIRFWNPTTGQHLTTLTGHTSKVTALTFSPDNTTLASGTEDGSIHLWNPTIGDHLITLTNEIRALSYSPDGTTLATTSGDDIQLWHPTTGECLTTLVSHSRRVNTIAYSPDGTILASSGSDGTIRFWNPTTGQHLTTLTGHTSEVTALSYSPDGTTLATGSWDGTIRLWNPTTGQHLTTLTGHTSGVTALSYSPDGTTLATGSWDGTIHLWSPTTSDCLSTLTGQGTAPTYSPDGTTLAIINSDDIQLWHPETDQHLTTLTGHAPHQVNALAYSPDGTTLATVSHDSRNSTIRLWNPITGQCLTGHTSEVNAIAYSPDGTTLATGSPGGTIRLWNPTTGQHLTTLTGHTSGVTALSYSPDGTTLATGSSDRTIRLWNPTTGECLTRLTDHTNRVTALTFSLDGTTLATGSWDGTIRLWNPTTGQHLTTLTGHTSGVTALSYSPDGTTLATVSAGGTIRLWNPTTGNHLTILSGHTNRVTALAFSPDSTTLATTGDDRTIRLWNPANGEFLNTLNTLTGHTNRVNTLTFSPDGTTLATASGDGTIRLWDPRDGSCLLAIGLAHFGPLDLDGYAVWSPSENKILHMEGEAWRCLTWARPRPDQYPELLPVEGVQYP